MAKADELQQLRDIYALLTSENVRRLLSEDQNAQINANLSAISSDKVAPKDRETAKAYAIELTTALFEEAKELASTALKYEEEITRYIPGGTPVADSLTQSISQIKGALSPESKVFSMDENGLITTKKEVKTLKSVSDTLPHILNLLGNGQYVETVVDKQIHNDLETKYLKEGIDKKGQSKKYKAYKAKKDTWKGVFNSSPDFATTCSKLDDFQKDYFAIFTKTDPETSKAELAQIDAANARKMIAYTENNEQAKLLRAQLDKKFSTSASDWIDFRKKLEAYEFYNLLQKKEAGQLRKRDMPKLDSLRDNTGLAEVSGDELQAKLSSAKEAVEKHTCAKVLTIFDSLGPHGIRKGFPGVSKSMLTLGATAIADIAYIIGLAGLGAQINTSNFFPSLLEKVSNFGLIAYVPVAASVIPPIVAHVRATNMQKRIANLNENSRKELVRATELLQTIENERSQALANDPVLAKARVEASLKGKENAAIVRLAKNTIRKREAEINRMYKNKIAAAKYNIDVALNGRSNFIDIDSVTPDQKIRIGPIKALNTSDILYALNHPKVHPIKQMVKDSAERHAERLQRRADRKSAKARNVSSKNQTRDVAIVEEIPSISETINHKPSRPVAPARGGVGDPLVAARMDTGVMLSESSHEATSGSEIFTEKTIEMLNQVKSVTKRSEMEGIQYLIEVAKREGIVLEKEMAGRLNQIVETLLPIMEEETTIVQDVKNTDGEELVEMKITSSSRK